MTKISAEEVEAAAKAYYDALGNASMVHPAMNYALKAAPLTASVKNVKPPSAN